MCNKTQSVVVMVLDVLKKLWVCGVHRVLDEWGPMEVCMWALKLGPLRSNVPGLPETGPTDLVPGPSAGLGVGDKSNPPCFDSQTMCWFSSLVMNHNTDIQWISYLFKSCVFSFLHQSFQITKQAKS